MGKIIKRKLPQKFSNVPSVDWYLVANRTEAVIFRKPFAEPLEFVDRVENPDGNKQETELTYDRAGRVMSSASRSIRHGYSKQESQEGRVAEKFARTIMRRLDEAKKNERFDQLVIAAEPHFLGLLRKYMSKNLEANLKAAVPKEFKHLTVPGIQTRIGSWIKEHRRSA